MPLWLIAVVPAQGDAWDLWAAVLLFSSRVLYSAGSVWSSNMKRLFHVGSHRGNPENIKIPSPNFKGCVPTSQATTIHSANFNKLFLHLSLILSEGHQHC